jgi:hypothetical protein
MLTESISIGSDPPGQSQVALDVDSGRSRKWSAVRDGAQRQSCAARAIEPAHGNARRGGSTVAIFDRRRAVDPSLPVAASARYWSASRSSRQMGGTTCRGGHLRRMLAASVQIARDETSLAGPPRRIIGRTLGGRRWRIVTCAIAVLIGTKWPRRGLRWRVGCGSDLTRLRSFALRPGFDSRWDTAVKTAAETLEDRIRERAYYLWEASGRPSGREVEFWHRAREMVATDGGQPKPRAKRRKPEKTKSAQPPGTRPRQTSLPASPVALISPG